MSQKKKNSVRLGNLSLGKLGATDKIIRTFFYLFEVREQVLDIIGGLVGGWSGAKERVVLSAWLPRSVLREPESKGSHTQ